MTFLIIAFLPIIALVMVGVLFNAIDFILRGLIPVLDVAIALKKGKQKRLRAHE